MVTLGENVIFYCFKLPFVLVDVGVGVPTTRVTDIVM